MAKTVFQVSPDGGTTKYDIRDTNIAPVELSSTASQAYAKGKQFILDSDGLLYEATGAISQGDTFVIYPTTNYNCKLADSVSDQIKDKTNKTDIARVEDGATASAEITKGTEFYHNSVLYKATTTISQGSAIVTSGTGQNCEIAPTVTEQIQSGDKAQEQLLEDTVGWISINNQCTLELGAWDYNSAQKVDNSYRLRSDNYLELHGIYDISITSNVGGKTAQYAWNKWATPPVQGETQSNIGDPGWQTDKRFKLDGYYTFNCRYSDNSETSINGMTIEVVQASVDVVKCDNSVIAPVENGSTASQAYAVGEHFIRDGAFCTCTQAISQGGSFTLNTNYTSGDVTDELNIENISASFYTSLGTGWSLGTDYAVYKQGKHIFGDITLIKSSPLTSTQEIVLILANIPKKTLNSGCFAGDSEWSITDVAYLYISGVSGQVISKTNGANITALKIHLDYII